MVDGLSVLSIDCKNGFIRKRKSDLFLPISSSEELITEKDIINHHHNDVSLPLTSPSDVLLKYSINLYLY